MSRRKLSTTAAIALVAVALRAEPGRSLRPEALIDLRTGYGARMARAEWRYHDAEIVEVAHRAPGPDGKPTGAPNRTRDIEPRAGAADFDDSTWQTIAPDRLEERLTNGRLAFGWYRVRITVPQEVGGFDTTGSEVVLEVVVDDYAEVWVDGELPVVLGQSGGRAVAGWNAPNRVVISRHAKPGMEIQIAIFAANAPLSAPPENYVWIRSAVLEFHRQGTIAGAHDVPCEVIANDESIADLVSGGIRAQSLATGFLFTEGPVWMPDGHLLFSDPNANAIYRWSEEGGVSIYRPKSGYTGPDVAAYRQPGSNGLAVDREGRLIVCEHGNRRVIRIERNGRVTVLADSFDGKRLNSPNDLVIRSDGTLFFTDPVFGLPGLEDDPRRELDIAGVYALIGGTLRLVSSELRGPNGVDLSPDERYLYVTNWDPARKVVVRYELGPDASVLDRRVLFDMTDAPGEEALDGLAVDERGDLWVSGPGGVWIISPEGRHLGTLRLPELPANFAWGGEDGRTLFATARTSLYRIRVGVGGARTASSVERHADRNGGRS